MLEQHLQNLDDYLVKMMDSWGKDRNVLNDTVFEYGKIVSVSSDNTSASVLIGNLWTHPNVENINGLVLQVGDEVRILNNGGEKLILNKKPDGLASPSEFELASYAKMAKDYDSSVGTINRDFVKLFSWFDANGNAKNALKADVAKDYDTTNGTIKAKFDAMQTQLDASISGQNVTYATMAKDYDTSGGGIKSKFDSIDSILNGSGSTKNVYSASRYVLVDQNTGEITYPFISDMWHIIKGDDVAGLPKNVYASSRYVKNTNGTLSYPLITQEFLDLDSGVFVVGKAEYANSAGYADSANSATYAGNATGELESRIASIESRIANFSGGSGGGGGINDGGGMDFSGYFWQIMAVDGGAVHDTVTLRNISSGVTITDEFRKSDYFVFPYDVGTICSWYTSTGNRLESIETIKS